jgi:hypothetical protein
LLGSIANARLRVLRRLRMSEELGNKSQPCVGVRSCPVPTVSRGSELDSQQVHDMFRVDLEKKKM